MGLGARVVPGGGQLGLLRRLAACGQQIKRPNQVSGAPCARPSAQIERKLSKYFHPARRRPLNLNALALALALAQASLLSARPPRIGVAELRGESKSKRE